MTPFAAPAFRWLWASSLASAAATGMLGVAVAWLAVDDGGGFGVGVVLAARMVPSLLFGLAAGTLADRYDRRRQLLAVAFVAAPLLVVLSRVAAQPSVPLWQLTLLSFATGCLSVFDIPARQALVMDVVPRPTAANAMALNALATRLCVALGALAAGLLIPRVSVAGVCLGMAGLYLLGGALSQAVRAPVTAPAIPEGLRPTFPKAIGEALRLIVDVPAVRRLMLAGVVCEVFGFSFQTAVPVVARNVLAAGPEALGTLNAATSLGGTLAVVGLSLLPSRVPREPLLSGVFVVYGVSLLALSTASSLPLAASVLVLTGACAASFDLLQQTLLQLAVPEQQRGRAIGIWVLGIGSAPLGHLEMGSVVALAGAPVALVVNGAVVVAAASILIARERWRTDILRPGRVGLGSNDGASGAARERGTLSRDLRRGGDRHRPGEPERVSGRQ